MYCLWIEWQIFPFADKINKLPEKIGSMQVPITREMTEKTWGKEYIHISTRDLKRQYNVCNFGLKAEISWLLKPRGEICKPLKRRGRSDGLSSKGDRSAGHSSKPISSSVCGLWPSYYFTKRVPASEKT